jgi:hypothetical protein
VADDWHQFYTSQVQCVLPVFDAEHAAALATTITALKDASAGGSAQIVIGKERLFLPYF